MQIAAASILVAVILIYDFLMDLRKLRHFVAVAEAGSMSGAAVRLRMAQPALTQSISRLEKEMRIRLFVRSKRGVELTEVGNFLLEEARDLLSRADAIARSAERHEEGSTGSITVGFVSTALYQILPSALAQLKRAAPEVRVRLREMRTNDQIEALRVGEIDIGLCQSPVRPETWLRHLTVAEYELLAVIPGGRSKACRDTITMKELAGNGLVLFPEGEGPPSRVEILDAFRKAGCEARIVQEASPTLAVLACISAGIGASLLPECVGFIGVEGVRMCNIQKPHALPSIGLALIRRIHPRRKIVDRLWQACIEQAAGK
jgi:DNA-binding transcriptional LysR family regulator